MHPECGEDSTGFIFQDKFDACVDEIDLSINEAQWFIDNLSSLMKDKPVSCYAYWTCIIFVIITITIIIIIQCDIAQ